MKKDHNFNLKFIILGIIVLIITAIIGGTIGGSQTRSPLFLLLYILSMAAIIFGLINYTKLPTWAKILIVIIGTPLVLLAIGLFIWSFSGFRL